MQGIQAFVVALTLASAAFAHAQTPEQLAAVEDASAVGWELYQHDQAAWHGTDAMLDEISDPRGEGFSGWITERTTDGVQVLFLRGQGDDIRAAYRALYRDGAIVETGRVDQALTATQVRINRARMLAIAAPLPLRCAQTYNSVTLTRETAGADGVDVDVYLMPAMATLQEAPFGGHFRYAIDTSAGVVREVEHFTNGCITLPIEPNAEFLFITQLIGDTPTEIHVFESLTTRFSVFVGAQSGV